MPSSIDMKIGIFGGAFDPPHRGHEKALAAFLEELKLDLCYCVPTGIPPHKCISGGADPIHRLELVRRALLPISDRVRIWEGELSKSEPSYSYQTVEEIALRHPGAKLFFLVGTDQFMAFETWREVGSLLSRAVLCVMERYGQEMSGFFEKKEALEKEFGATCLLLREKAYIISSTQIREELRTTGFSRALSPSVNEWITVNGLYVQADPQRRKALDLVKECLSPERFSHTLAVEREVVRLGSLFDCPDLGEMRLAALFHDRTKEWTSAEHTAFLKSRGAPLPHEDLESPAVLHGRTAAILAEEEMGLSRKAAEAIYCHTTGKPGMTLEEKLLYLADFIEETRLYDACRVIRRRFYDGLPRDREGRLSRLDACVLAAMEHTLERLKKEKRPIHPQTLLGAADLKQRKDRA